MVADTISQLNYNPKVNPNSKFNYTTFGMSAKGETMVKWKTFSKLWRCYNKNNPGNETQECNLNQVFANRSKEEEIFPLTTPEIAEAQMPTTNSSIASSQCITRQRNRYQIH
jgi:hypothetical protein